MINVKFKQSLGNWKGKPYDDPLNREIEKLPQFTLD